MVNSFLQALAVGAASLCPMPPEIAIPGEGVVEPAPEELLVLTRPVALSEADSVWDTPNCLQFVSGLQGLESIERGERFWTALHAQPEDPDQSWGLRLTDPGARELCVAWPQQAGGHHVECARTQHLGAVPEESLRDGSLFVRPGDFDADRPVLLSTASHVAVLPPMKVGTTDQLHQDLHAQFIGTGLAYGALLVLFIYGLILLVATRRSVAGWFSAYVGLYGLALFIGQGLPRQWLGLEVPGTGVAITFMLIGLSTLAGGWFLVRFLELGRNNQLARNLLLLVVGLSAAGMFYTSFTLERWAGDLGAWMFSLAALAAAVYGLRLGRRNALPLMIGFGLMALVRIYNNLARVEVLPSFGLDSFAILQIGLILAAASIGLALNRELQNLRQERDQASLLAETHQRIALYRSEYDTITGLPNRQRLVRNIGEHIAARNADEGVGVLVVNVDDFREIRNLLGYEGSNEVLRVLADRLRDLEQEGIQVGRMQGDEFALVAPLPATRECALAGLQKLAERVQERLGQPIVAEGQKLDLRVSMGAGHCPVTGASADQTLEQAVNAAFEARERGGNCLVTHGESEGSNLLRRWRIRQRLEQTLEEEALEVAFQPVIEMDTGRIRGVEALARWNDAELGQVPPSVFIPVAESFGLIGWLGQQVTEKALEALAEWDRQGLPRVVMATNLSPIQLQEPQLLAAVQSTLERHGLSARRLVIELTENSLVENFEAAREQLHALAALGARIAVDDFGVGYSSLSYLRELPLHIIKIDRSFVSRVDEEDTGLVASMLEMARRLGLNVVAEGIETEGQAQALRRHGCRLAQGFLYARPMEAAAVAKLLRQGGVEVTGSAAENTTQPRYYPA